MSGAKPYNNRKWGRRCRRVALRTENAGVSVPSRRRARFICVLVSSMLLLAIASPALELPAVGQSADILDMVVQPPASNAARRECTAETFIRAGALPTDISYHPFWRQGVSYNNIVLAIPGAGEGVFIVGAHTDTQPVGTGAVDNWSGCMMLASLYGRFRTEHLNNTWIFVAFAAEEHGQHGSRAFTTSLPKETRARVRAMINLECLGVSHLRTWANASADALEDVLQTAAAESGADFSRDVLFGYSADSFTFTRVGIPSITVHSLAPDDLKLINGPDDQPSCIHRERLDEELRVFTRYIQLLDARTEPIPDTDAEDKLRQAPTSLMERAGGGDLLASAAGAGVVVRNLPRNGAEFRAGVRDGDVVQAVRGYPVETVGDLSPLLLTLHKGMEVPITIRRPAEDPVTSGEGEKVPAFVEKTLIVKY